jgi:hypothetical protein
MFWIWLALVIVLIAMLGYFAWWLFRKFLVLTDDLESLAMTLEAFDDVETVTPSKTSTSILEKPDAVRARFETNRAAVRERSEARRTTRLERAKRITSATAADREWPADWK